MASCTNTKEKSERLSTKRSIPTNDKTRKENMSPRFQQDNHEFLNDCANIQYEPKKKGNDVRQNGSDVENNQQKLFENQIKNKE